MSDAQAGHEKTITSLLPALAGANLIYGMGMLELGLTFDFGQMVMDDEFARMNRRILEGILYDRETLGLEAIRSVGSEGHFMREKHTRAFGAREQSKVKVIDRRMRSTWEKKGGEDLHARSLARAKEILRTHEVAPLPPEVLAVFEDVKRRVG